MRMPNFPFFTILFSQMVSQMVFGVFFIRGFKFHESINIHEIHGN